MSRPERATLLVRGEEVSVTWEELARITRLAHDDPQAAEDLGDEWLAREAVTMSEACGDCGHLHIADGCSGPPTPSDLWAGVSPSKCDCNWGLA